MGCPRVTRRRDIVGLDMTRGALASLALAGCFMDNPAWLGVGEAASGSSSGGDAAPADGCEPLSTAPSDAIVVAPSDASVLASAIADAGAGATVLLADGEYVLGAESLVIDTAGVTLRSQSGDPERVVLDGGASVVPLVIVRAPDVRIAELTFTRGLTSAIQIDPTGPLGANGVSLTGIRFIDPGTSTVDVIAAEDGSAYADDGRIECSTFRRAAMPTAADACTFDSAVQVRGGRGWSIRANTFERFGCGSPAPPTVAVRDGARDSLITHNRFVDCARAVLIGNRYSGEERVWADATCSGMSPWGHVGGLVANNVAWVGDPQVEPDSMFSLWSACDGRVYHNTAVGVGSQRTS